MIKKAERKDKEIVKKRRNCQLASKKYALNYLERNSHIELAMAWDITITDYVQYVMSQSLIILFRII